MTKKQPTIDDINRLAPKAVEGSMEKRQAVLQQPDELDEIFENSGLLETQYPDIKQRLNKLIDKAVREAVTKITLAGMPGLTPAQQDYITKWLESEEK